MKTVSITFIAFFLYLSQVFAESIDLSGKWQVALDSTDTGIKNQWFNKNFDQVIHLPGTLCDAGYGIPCTLQPTMEKDIFLNLKRKYDYVGVAWYRKQIEIPADWKNKDILLNLERVIWNTQVWIDGKKTNGFNESLSVPQSFDLTSYLTPGKHTLVIRIDNRSQHDISIRNMAHAYTNETQTLWNGVIGEIAINAEEKIRMNEMRLTPDIDNKKVHVDIRALNSTNENANRKISFFIQEPGGKNLAKKEVRLVNGTASFDYFISDPKLWDEFNPNLYKAVAELKTGNYSDTKSETFGMRKLTNKNALLQINDRRLFLRGTLECCIFPLKGYPPMEKSGWKKVFEAAKSYGLNHLRFHSWCPPKAAFEVADEMGFYLQIELPLWVLTIGQDEKTTKFLYAEADRIMKEYGNHPSFCFWSLGNELQGDFAVMDNLLMTLKKQDQRHLYMTTTFTFEKGHGDWPEPHDDFWITQRTKKGWVRGQGIFDDQPVHFDKDYSVSVDSLTVPIITHEIGQYSVFPNLKEIDKYTGNLMPLNFKAVAEDLKKKGRLDQAEDYLIASGKLAAILYKEEIERALKTPGFSGFQLLDLHDFPGQGTALVGLLDAFWETKGLITPEAFRNFCSPVVPLANFEKATYTNDETFLVKIEAANFSDQVLQNIIPVWKLTDSKNRVIAQGELPEKNLTIGNTFNFGTFSVPLSSVSEAEKLILSISFKNTNYKNSWEIWVYPKNIRIETNDVFYTRSFDEAKQALTQGKKVLFNPVKEEMKGLEGQFVQVFWSPVHFPNQPGTMGILCDPKHPAFSYFPTEMHSNWQWWDICKNAKTMELDSIQSNLKPLVRMVDNFFKNRNLGLLFESRVGKGKLLVCSSDINNNLETRPVARQLRYSLIRYMQSDKFTPLEEISFDPIEKSLYNNDRTEEKKKSIYSN